MTDKLTQDIIIRKASGQTESFDVNKFRRSLDNAGADAFAINEITRQIQDELYTGIPTRKIYAIAYRLLKKMQNHSALRYKLKSALLQLGPTGYPFEQLIGELYRKIGYTTEVGQVLHGRCITHEMDVIATRDNEQLLMECKYSKDQGRQVSIQVPLYVRSRVDDIVMNRKTMPEFHGFDFTACVVTNTRFSVDSEAYSECSGMKLLAWDYPSGNGLKDLMEKYGVFPVTILTQLTLKDKSLLIEQGIVTCNMLLNNPEAIKALNLNKRKYNSLLKELEACSV